MYSISVDIGDNQQCSGYRIMDIMFLMVSSYLQATFYRQVHWEELVASAVLSEWKGNSMSGAVAGRLS